MKKLALLGLIVIVFIILIFGRSTDDTSEIEAVINKMAEAGRNGVFEGVSEHVSIEYRDDYGATYLIIKNIIEKFFQKFDKFETKNKNLTVSIDETENGNKTAIANLDIYITGYNSGVPIDILGKENSYQNITIYLKKTKLLGWKITKADGFDNIIEDGY